MYINRQPCFFLAGSNYLSIYLSIYTCLRGPCAPLPRSFSIRTSTNSWNFTVTNLWRWTIFCPAKHLFIKKLRVYIRICSGRDRIWRRFSVFCLLSVKVCSWYKTHSNTGILTGVRYVFFWSVPGFQFGPVTVSFETFSGHKTMMYTVKVGFTIVNNLIQHRGLDCHLILQTVSRY